MCTSKARASDANYCNANDLVNGACCPEDSVPCNYNKPDQRCMENPEYGMVKLMYAYESSKHNFKQVLCARQVIPFRVAEVPCAQI